MQQREQTTDLGQTKQPGMLAAAGTLPPPLDRREHLAEIAHDARNMIMALDLYCDLLQEPGVLAGPFSHYGEELRLVAAASRQLIGKLTSPEPVRNQRNTDPLRDWKSVPSEPIANLAQELWANRNLLDALAGPAISLTMDVQGGAVPVRLTGEELTRILVNLVKNAAEAMKAGGRIQITLLDSRGWPGNSPWIALNVEDNGPGLPDKILEGLLDTPRNRQDSEQTAKDWPVGPRGLGLSIIQSIVENAGGMIRGANRDPSGACFQIELPALVS